MYSQVCRSGMQFTALITMLFIIGCGETPAPTGSLRGKVTFNGTAVGNAKIQIQESTTGESFATKVGGDGSYQFDSPITTGQYVVTVIPDFEAPVAGSVETPPAPPERKDIPEIYRTTAKSDLKVEIKEGANEFNAEMK